MNRSKHIDVRFHFLKEVDSGEIRLIYRSTAQQPADVFTKAVNADIMKIHSDSLCLLKM